MFILSSSPCSSSTFFTSITPRVSFSSSSRPCLISLRSTARKPTCPSLFHSLKVRAMAELVQDKESTDKIAGSIVASSSVDGSKDIKYSRKFLNARTEQELLSGIKKEAEAGLLPSNIAAAMEELYLTYKSAVFKSGNPEADEVVLSNMTVALDRIFLDVEDPFVFEPYHKAIREPFDYYMFGQSYIRPLVDFKNSYVGNISIFCEIEDKLKQGHNIIFISNHQTEADPAIIALLLEKTNPHIAENLIYVAGDRVIADPLCKPFSMGRNLICVYSKKHMLDVPELVEMKRKANTRSLKEMAFLLKRGSQIVWIAPSGGRDRPEPHTGEWYPAPFDTSSVDNMRRLAEHSGPQGHIYPLAILCHDIMPPPRQVEKEIGERRDISFHGTGLSVAPEISFSEIAAAYRSPEEAKEAYTGALYNSVNEQYKVLKSAIHDKKGLEASTPSVSLSQPWN
ncbi:Glycerol-3-phosphate acyltransferase, chloroplastic [Quillaja saponaria]|uniref:Glycerol-3-phosphate acyltransferase, chloroplastic n=1 Tax=Quillaja saponaria TaxID=32244 RepID=A0AAD7PFW8_QUISA|nr:Glycerol-3-phosphate acyltransferase, chloroplastic [Quillaja saponaria]KAJ7953401.1 Glycerol-3-phosphate acyltransferase, chloroplastic [Quillaja saponaria]